MNRKIKKLINLIEKSIRKLYHKLPVSSAFKTKAKNCFFTVFGCFMKNTPSYIIWKQTRVKHKKSKKKIAYDDFVNFKMDKKIAVQLHLFYIDLLDEFVEYLKNIPYSFDLFISVVDDSQNEIIYEKTKKIDNVGNVIVRRVDNRGRDVAPLLVVFCDEIAKYDYVCHVHSKKSLYTGREQTGWRRYLLDGLMGDVNQVYRTFYLLETDPDIALVYPESYPEITYMAHTWMSNKDTREWLMTKIGCYNTEYPMFVDFPLGTMFWGRVEAILPFFKANIKLEDFPKEEGQKDGTIAHAFERCLGAFVKLQGYKVAVYDEEEDEFSIGFGRKNLNQYWQKSPDLLVNEADRYDIISFDIFDTLLMRKTVNPDDLFDITELRLKAEKDIDIQYRKLRKKAEKNLRKSRTKADYSIDDIYEEFAKITGFDKEKCDTVKNMEVDTECRYLVPRESMVEAFNTIVQSLKKKVVLISDMYLTKEILEPILKKNGIDGYSELLISCEKQARKEDGTLWDMFLKENSGKEIMHVGDNELSDTQIPGDKGIFTHHILSAKELFNLTNIGRAYRKQEMTALDSVAMGLVLNKYFNDPYGKNSAQFNIKISRPEELGYAIIGPIVCDYMVWAVKEAEKSGIKQLLFLAREGYLFTKIFEIMKKNTKRIAGNGINGHYFYTSRRSSLVASIKDVSDIKSALNVYYEGTVNGLLKGRFGIDVEEMSDTVIALPQEATRTFPMIENYADAILKNAEEERKNYLKYIEKILGDTKKMTAMFDLGYSGSIQYYLSKIMNSPHAGFYFATDAKRHPMKIEGSRMYARYIENDETAPASASSIHRYSLLLESVLTAPDSQFVCMDEVGNPVFAESDKSEEYTEFILSIQEGVLKFAKDFFELTGDLIFECPMNKDVYEELIRLVVEEDVVSEDLKNKFVMEDNFCTDECINVFDRLSENLRD